MLCSRYGMLAAGCWVLLRCCQGNCVQQACRLVPPLKPPSKHHTACLQCAASTSAKAATPVAALASSTCSCERPLGPRHRSVPAGLFGGHSWPDGASAGGPSRLIIRAGCWAALPGPPPPPLLLLQRVPPGALLVGGRCTGKPCRSSSQRLCSSRVEMQSAWATAGTASKEQGAMSRGACTACCSCAAGKLYLPNQNQPPLRAVLF